MNERINPLLQIDRILEEFQDRVPIELARRRIRKVQEGLKSNCENDWRNFDVDLLSGSRRRLNDKFLNEFFGSFGIEPKIQSIRRRKTCISDGERGDILRVKGVETSLEGVTLELWQHLRTRENHYPWIRVTAILDEDAKTSSVSPVLPPLL